ncbi:rhodanese-like domain-containing protein [Oscillochloris sp. ZM17-4]|uniref:rhodanese-like domain-containing protein n=1 Tax=Oscillochloris sp. ZM17-4 TaxID=2866714 RepID=UPI001C73DE64|nr:rhodanese-like domain-containing protein [Oscillochloris sp. ZM17-4]MBX0330929.1 rhodanese-like domain-containing protein [Oscillochloris sp. ZM17-4]
MRARTLSLLILVLGALALAACGAAAPAATSSSSGPKTLTQLSVTDLNAKLTAGESLFLLDVRTPEEFTQDGHVAQATLIPLDQLDSRLAELPSDQPIACICRSGNRSTTACNDLLARGYDVTNVTGGMNAWKAAGLPVAAP